MKYAHYKYDLPLVGKNEVMMPRGAEIFKVGAQRDGLKLWAFVDPDEKVMIPVDVYVFSTGEAIEADDLKPLTYLDTVICQDDTVWHVWHE